MVGNVSTYLPRKSMKRFLDIIVDTYLVCQWAGTKLL